MSSSSVTTTADHAPRRGRPAARITVVSPELVEMDEVAFEAAVEAMANVLRLDWDLDSVLNEQRPA